MSKLKDAIAKANEVEMDEGKSSEVIKDLIATDWSSDNEAQMKASQLIKGLSLSDEPAANKFMKALDKYTSSLNPDDYK